MHGKQKTSVVAWLGAMVAMGFCGAVLTGCGQKGPLTLPGAAAGSAASAASAAAASAPRR